MSLNSLVKSEEQLGRKFDITPGHQHGLAEKLLCIAEVHQGAHKNLDPINRDCENSAGHGQVRSYISMLDPNVFGGI